METDDDRPRPGPVHFALIFFTATTVIAGVMAFELNQDVKAQREEIRNSSATIQQLEDDLRKCRTGENAGI